MQTQKDSTLYGRPSIKYRGGTARNDVSWLNVMVPGDAVLVGSITAVKVSVSVIPAGDGGPVASTSTVYRGQKHAADLTHRKDTSVAGPSGPATMTNTPPSSKPKMNVRRCGPTGACIEHQAGTPSRNMSTGIEWDTPRCDRRSCGRPVKSQPGSVQPHGPCGHAI